MPGRPHGRPVRAAASGAPTAGPLWGAVDREAPRYAGRLLAAWSALGRAPRVAGEHPGFDAVRRLAHACLHSPTFCLGW